MPLEGQQSAPAEQQNQAPAQEAQQDDGGFESAVKALEGLEDDGGVNFGQDPQSDQIPVDANLEADEDQVKSLDDIDGLGEKKPKEEQKAHGLDLDKIAERERGLWKEKKLQKEASRAQDDKIAALEAKISQMESAPTKQEEVVEEENIEDMDESSFDEMIQDLVNSKKGSLSKDDVIDLIKEARAKDTEEANSQMQEMEVEEQVATFQEEIKNYTKENAESFPAISATGSESLVFDVIEQDYREKAEEYGHEYAEKNMINLEQASQRVNKHLVSELEKMLTYEPMKKLLMQLAGGSQGNNQNNSHQNPGTITEDFNSSQATGEMDDEERFKRAVAALG